MPRTQGLGACPGYNKHQLNDSYSYKINTEVNRDFSNNFDFHWQNAHFKKKEAPLT